MAPASSSLIVLSQSSLTYQGHLRPYTGLAPECAQGESARRFCPDDEALGRRLRPARPGRPAQLPVAASHPARKGRARRHPCSPPAAAETP